MLELQLKEIVHRLVVGKHNKVNYWILQELN